MADDNKNNQNPAGGDNGEGGDNKNVNKDSQDPNKDKGGQDDKGGQSIPKYRFDEVSGELQKLKAEKEEREKKDKEAEDKRLAEQGQYKELLTKREEELKGKDATIRTLKIQNAVERAASKAGAIDTEAVLKLVDASKIKEDKEGNLTGVDEAVKELLEAKPFLKGSGNSPANVGGGSNPATPAGNKKPISWVRERWADPKWTREKHEDLGGLTGEEYLNKIEREGQIDYNL